MRSFITLAAVLPAAYACVSPKSHKCAAAFAADSDAVESFCATYTAGGSATSVPSAFDSACDGNAKSLSSQCKCYATGAATGSVPAATSEAAPLPSSNAANATAPSFASQAVPTTFATVTLGASSGLAPSSGFVASSAAVAASSVIAATSVAAVETGSSGTGGTALSSLAGGSGVGGTTCTVTAAADVTAAASSCSNILLSAVTIPASSAMTVTVPTSGALLFAGTMTVEYTPDADYTPIVLKGSNAKIAGLAGAVIDGQGAKYWDGEGSNGGTAKPDHFIKLSDLESSTFEQLTIQNWPTHLFEITGCTDMTISNVILDNSAGSELGHNTDAFDVSSTDGLYVSSATVYNQDDCVAVNSGSNMVFENMYCDGSHGLSIGSIKSDVTVSNVTFKDSSVLNAANACRIKTTAGESGSTVSDITYSNIYVSNITDYAIDIQQDYENGSPTGDPTTGITVSGVTFSGISGSVDSDGYDYYILCGSTSSCSDITFEDITVSGGQESCSPSSLCSSLSS